MNRSKKYQKSVGGRWAAAVALSAMVVLVAVPALASPDLGRAVDGVEVPFRAEQTLQASSVDFGGRCAPLPTVTADEEGEATHLGRYTAHETYCFAFDPGTGIVTLSDGLSTATAADGSQLFAEFESMLIPTETPGILEFDGAVTFVGGTGRFEGASGFAVTSGTSEPPATTFILGTLVLPL